MRQDKTPLRIPTEWVMDGEKDSEIGAHGEGEDEYETEWQSCGNENHAR